MMNEYLAWVKENGKIELRYWLYWKVWAMILITAFVMFVYNVCHNLVYYIAGDYGVYGGSENQLVDLGFKAFDWAADLWFWPNFCLYLLAALSLAFLASISFTRKIITNPDVHIAQAAWRACLVACVVVPLRCISFLITIIPAPADHCSKDGGFSPPADVAEIFTRFDIGYGCSDLVCCFPCDSISWW
ncbi:hypothetical protein C9890_0153 [Perkinsus sp. BL_2016]|nr:hypothetical protein C9890_0153 [Perkinsus sp. BL_2016]